MSGQRTRPDVPVLVCGGGPVGLTMALLLRHHGVEVLLVERHHGTSPQPKARRFHVRSMEIFREMGLACAVRDAARDLVGHDHMAAGHTMAEAQQLPLPHFVTAEAPQISPELPCLVAQDVLEPVLREAAVAAGADVRFGTELTDLRIDDGRVAVELASGGTTRRVTAAHLVAADGARSPIRERLAISRSGPGALSEPAVNVYFRADLGDVVAGRPFNLCQIGHPDAPGGFASIDGRHRWVFMTRAAGDTPDWPGLLRTALGVPAPDLEVLSVLDWQPEMRVADRLSVGPVHLVGDAAHVMPPYAALGANTGIADAHNLAWKLAAVLGDGAGPTLLDSYHAERHPAGWFAGGQSARRADPPPDTDETAPTGAPQALSGTSTSTRASTPAPAAHPFVLAAGGFQYPTGAFEPGPDDAGDPEPVDRFAPAGRVGTRIPHSWRDAARTRSTIDLAGPGWALVSAVAHRTPSGTTPSLTREPRTAPSRPGASPGGRADPFRPGRTVRVLPEGTVSTEPGRDLLLIRPDHVVAWRGNDPAAAERTRARLLAQ